MENEYQSVEISGSQRVSATYSDPRATQCKDNKNLQQEEAFSLAKVLNQLVSEQRSLHKKAANALETQYLRDDSTEQAADKPTITAAFAETAKPLFKRFNDPVGNVREICIRITIKFIAEEEDLIHYLPYLIPAITRRVNSQYGYDEENQVFSRDQFLHDAFKRGRVYVAENQVARVKPDELSEEIRLLLLGLLDAVLENAFQRRASSILHAYIFDILLVLISGVHDDFHEVNIASC
ncbi:hypothetical protein V7S43_003032 [Phytophthora oleae]|uniref:Dynein axonemal assembly factor 5 TPR repeats domain-containing protein n=1 Tax=Phytophthora oleae TaxID=2107226 RepID=A0ABD3FZW8_9STRA